MPIDVVPNASVPDAIVDDPIEPRLASVGWRGHRGTRAVERMVEFAPSTGGLALWVSHEDVDERDASPIATDGSTIRYGPAFERLDLDLQTGLVAHQVLHIALRHVPRHRDLQGLIGDVDLRLFNVCADALVNSTLDHLGWLRLPVGSVRLDLLLERVLGLRVGVEEALLAWDVERLYRAIDDRGVARETQARRGATVGSGASQRSGSAGGSSSGDEEAGGRPDGSKAAAARALGASIVADLKPAVAAADAPEDRAEQTRTWTERLVRAHANDGAFSMMRTLVADLPRSRTPWEQVLRTRLARGLSTRPAPSWSRPSRSYLANQGRAGPHRLPWEPGFGATRSVPRLAVIVDVSGSIDAPLLDRFATEVEAITRRLEAGLLVVVGDDRVRSVTRFEPGRSDLRSIAFEGGGGTDFTPLLEEADRHRPDIGLILTDLDGPARFEPRWPVLWTVPVASRNAIAPFGRKLVLG